MQQQFRKFEPNYASDCSIILSKFMQQRLEALHNAEQRISKACALVTYEILPSVY